MYKLIALLPMCLCMCACSNNNIDKVNEHILNEYYVMEYIIEYNIDTTHLYDRFYETKVYYIFKERLDIINCDTWLSCVSTYITSNRTNSYSVSYLTNH